MIAEDEELEAILDEEADEMLGDLDAKERTLHEALRQVLEERGGGWMHAQELAKVIYVRDLYTRKDRGTIPPGQIRARAANYPDLFEGATDDSNRVRLRVRGEDSGRVGEIRPGGAARPTLPLT
jgi:hypothetical protein